MQQPSVAIVILNWNGQRFLEQFLPALKQTTYSNCTIVVADNGSTDNSVSFLNQYHPDVAQVFNGKNKGFAGGYNAALQQVQADYYVLLNSDVEVTPGWIEPVIELMEKDASIGACQPKILAWHQKNQFEYAGGSGGYIDVFGYPFCRGRVFDVCEEDQGQYNDARPVFWASGCAYFVRSAVYHQLKGLDDFFFAHQEEIDLCWRMQRMGYSVWVCPQSVVYHVGGGTLAKGNPRKTFLNYRNCLIMLWKNLTGMRRLLILFIRMVLDGVSAIQQLVKGDVKYFIAVIKAHFHFYGWLMRGKTPTKFSAVKKTALHGIYAGSVVWQYFIKGRKKFSEIVDNKAG